MRKIRVLHVFSVMNRGGAETMIMDLYRQIDKNLFEFDFVVHSKEKGAFDEEIKKMGGRILYVPKYKGLNHFDYIRKWNEVLSTNIYDIVHGHVRSTASIYLNIAKQKEIITIAHSHSTSNGKNLSSLVKKLYQLPLKRIPDYFFAASKDAGNWLFGADIENQSNFYLLRNAIDAKKYIFNKSTRNKYRKKMDLEGKFVLGHIGSFKKEKNHKYLLDIFIKIHEKKQDIILILVGDGDEREEISKKVRAYGLEEKVIFTGVRSDVTSLLQAMDVFVFPSLFEGFGIVAIESQAAGLQTIVSNQIPKEAYLTDLIDCVNLSADINEWVKTILQYSVGYERKDTSEMIIKSGYDVSQSVIDLQNLYKSFVRTRNESKEVSTS